MVEKVKSMLGTIYGLVNNAGINIPRLLVDPDHQYELDEAVWNRVMDVNVKGVFLCAQAVARELEKNGGGVIVNVSSECGLEGSEGQSVYAASKNAVNSLTRSWAKELGKRGIRVVGIAPGILEATGLRTAAYEEALAYTRGITVDELHKSYAKTATIPLGRSGRMWPPLRWRRLHPDRHSGPHHYLLVGQEVRLPQVPERRGTESPV